MTKLIYQPVRHPEGGYYYYIVPELTPGQMIEVDDTEAERLLATGQFQLAPDAVLPVLSSSEGTETKNSTGAAEAGTGEAEPEATERPRRRR